MQLLDTFYLPTFQSLTFDHSTLQISTFLLPAPHYPQYLHSNDVQSLLPVRSSHLYVFSSFHPSTFMLLLLANFRTQISTSSAPEQRTPTFSADSYAMQCVTILFYPSIITLGIFSG